VKLPYDLVNYSDSLCHHGIPLQLNGWDASLIRRTISDTPHTDCIGPWPYATLPEDPDQIKALYDNMVAQKLISFSACARPDQLLSAPAWAAAGYEAITLKPHFVHRPNLPAPERSAKTRANLNKARRHWKPALLPASESALKQFSAWHDELNQRKDMSLFTRLPCDHFQQLAGLDGCHLMTASDDKGPAAAVILMLAGNEVHCHAQAGASHAYTHRAFYALYDAILKHWGSTHTIYLGGAPGGKDGPGIERFKRRFSNATSEVMMVRAILDPKTSDELAHTRGDPQWFPPYRSRR
jgi:hypothetical protein